MSRTETPITIVMDGTDEQDVGTEGIDADDEQDLLEQDPVEREILEWRLGQIRSLGFPQIEAQLLADGGADLGLLRHLVGKGCPPHLAFRIAF
jgi:hypothetical protein